MKLLGKSYLLTLLFFIGIAFSSCETDNEDQVKLEGIYIVNEGQFGNNNGSISLLDPESNALQNNYFQKQNGRSPGDIVQDLSFIGDKGFIVVNNSKKVEIVDKNTFETIDVIGNVSYPRQFISVSDKKGYLTNGTSADGSNGHVYVIDLQSHSITDTIEVGKGPESMVMLDNDVFVTNAGGYSVGNTVSVINSNTDEVTEKINVSNLPTDIIVDKNNNVWVYCKGDFSMETYTYEASLVKINTSDYTTEFFKIGGISAYGNYLLTTGPEKEYLYYVGIAGVYKMNINESELPSEAHIDKIPYGLDVNPANGQIYCLTSTQSKGFVYRYDKNHNLLDSAEVGYSPNAIVFE